MPERLDEHVSLQDRERLLRALTAATDELLQAARTEEVGPFRASVGAALKRVGEAIGADGAQVFQFCDDPFGGMPVVCRRFYWTRDGARPSSPPGFGRWSTSLREHGPFCVPIDTLPVPERTALESDGVAFVMVLPVMVDGALWGGMRFDTEVADCDWSLSDARLLEAMAENFGLAIDRPLGEGDPDTLTPIPSFEASEIPRTEGDAQDGEARNGKAVAERNSQRVVRSTRVNRLAVVAPGGRILHQDATFSAFVGHEQDAINRAGGFPACIARSAVQEEVKQLLQEGSSFEGAVHLNTVDQGGNAVHLRIEPVRNEAGTHLCSMCWFQTGEDDGHGDLQHSVRLRKRVRAERALVQASQLLMSSSSVNMEELLRIVGEATEADHAYLVTIAPEVDTEALPLMRPGKDDVPPIQLDAYREYEWYAPGNDAAAEEGAASGPDTPSLPDASARSQTFAVPILSGEDQLFGYLGIEHQQKTSPLEDYDARVLNVLGDMICTYLQRQLSDQALRQSERHYRHFVDTISEAIWRVEIDPPLDTTRPHDEQVRHLLDHGVIAECNTEMANLFGLDRPEQLVGWDVGTIIRRIGPKLVEDLIKQAYGLRNQELAIKGPSGNMRHFIISTTGVVEDEQLVRLWGSSTEVTDRVELERRMVTALEEQQRRIGQDLHDNVGQLLTGVRMLSQNVGDRHFEEGSSGYKQIEKIVRYASEAAQHVSDLQRGLMPVQMERAGLAQALQELAGNTNVFPDVECIYIHDDETDVTDHEIKLQLYRIAQEATNNALKHAEPSYIKIVFKTRDDHILLQVEDDGQGFDVDTSELKSLGLHSMHYRARSINATLDIDAEPGMGTLIHCEVPLRELSEAPRSEG